MTNRLKKFIGILLAIVMIAVLAGCSKKPAEEEGPSETEKQTVSEADTDSETEPETTTEEPTTPAPTTEPETTTAAPQPGESIQGIVDTLESKRFYMAGTMNFNGGQTMEAKATCDGDNYRMEMSSRQMKLSIIYMDEVPYIVNNSTNMYVVIDEAAINSMDQVMKSFSGFGVVFNNDDINGMKNMMSNFDMNMDYSQYINDGEFYEFTANVNGIDYLCSSYETDYGMVRIYTLDGALKMIDVFDADGLRQMNFVVSAFIPEILTPISLNGLTKSTSILNLFTAS